MSKTIIEVKCTDQVLTLTNTPVIASGGVGEDFVSVRFCDMWEDYTPSLLFWRKGVDPIPVLFDEHGLFQVPAELTGVDGIVYFGAVGYDADGNRRTSNAISYRLEAGAITEGAELPAPSGDVFDQIMAYYADVKLYVATRIDEAANAAHKSENHAEASWLAADEAQRRAGEAVDAARNIVPFEPLECKKNADMLFITVDKLHEGKMLVSFVSPCPSSEVTQVLLLRSDGASMSEFLALRDSSGSGIGPGAFLQGDHVIALLDAEMETAFILNPRVTKDATAEMDRRIHPGIPSSYTENGCMVVGLDYTPKDKMFLVFSADCDASSLVEFRLAYDDDTIPYLFVDGSGISVSEHAFYQGDYVVVVLDPATKRATMINPRMTLNVQSEIQGLINEINALKASDKTGMKVVEYTGNGNASLTLNFEATPKVIQIESTDDPSYYVSAILFKESGYAKIRWFSDGNKDELMASLGELGSDYVWMDGTKFVQLVLGSNGIPVAYLNRKNAKYIAIGYM